MPGFFYLDGFLNNWEHRIHDAVDREFFSGCKEVHPIVSSIVARILAIYSNVMMSPSLKIYIRRVKNMPKNREAKHTFSTLGLSHGGEERTISTIALVVFRLKTGAIILAPISQI